ncbi:MAG TPA: SusD/RagB family nutrient-binding outer membrane lipoprotein, partial [Longimicrobiales bacterium]|nr:SusD/RagB family nutrient-binding outer membrane lipoprotein [Longimicrobiales bacterium]
MTIKQRVGRALGVALVTLTLGACEFISPVESNPNSVPEATVDQLFTAVQVNSFFLAGGGLSRIASIWTQQMAGTDRQFVTFDNYTITEADFDDEMDALYTGGGLIDLRTAIAQAEEAGRREYAGILKIHEAFMVGLIASFYGDIPYTEAVAGVDDPVLDDQADVYGRVQALLDAAIGDLAGGGVGPGSLDMNFGGDTDAWEAVAYTLKARFHMHWAEVQGASAYTAARAAALNGIQSAADDWEAKFGAAATENNLWYQFQRDRSGYISAGDFLPPLMGTDPRTSSYFDASPATPRSSDLSSTGFGAPGFDFPIATCSENYFILAEAEYRLGSEANAIAAAQDALACEEARWGLQPPNDLSEVSDDIANLTGTALFNTIMDQKYIAQFLNPDAYNDYKRTCRPAITERANGMPGRLYYSQGERQANDNVPAAGTDPNDKYNDNDP